MFNISNEQKEKFKEIVDKKTNDKVKFINIALLKPRENLINHLIVNDISFNTIVDKDGAYDLVPMGWLTNGCYKVKERVYCNPYVSCFNIGVIIDNELDILKECLNLKTRLREIVLSTGIRLFIGDNVNIINDAREYDEIFKKVDSDYIVDVVFRYFRQLFVIYS